MSNVRPAVDDAWADRTPLDAARVLDGYPGLWWMAGGWAIEAFTAVARPHSDCDPSILRSDLPLFVTCLGPRWECWAAADGELSALDPEHLPPNCFQVWLRRSASATWEFDLLLSDGDDEDWVYRRDPSITMPMNDALWKRGGVSYLHPEVQLLYKAKRVRPKDQQDFDVTEPMLSPVRRRWLAASLEATLPGHPTG